MHVVKSTAVTLSVPLNESSITLLASGENERLTEIIHAGVAGLCSTPSGPRQRHDGFGFHFLVLARNINPCSPGAT